MKLINLEQRTPEWLEWKKFGIGSSEAPVLVNGKHFQKTRSSLKKEKVAALLGKAGKGARPNSAMQRGIDSEPEVTRRYRLWTGYDVQPACAEHDVYSWLRVSLDGLGKMPDGRLIIAELKVPGTRWNGENDHFTVLQGQIPEKYIPQLDHQLLVTELDLLHYVSYCPDLPPVDRFRVLPHYRDAQRIERLFELEKVFWEEVETEVRALKPEGAI